MGLARRPCSIVTRANTPYEILGHDIFGVKKCCGRQASWLKQKGHLDTGVPTCTKIVLDWRDTLPLSFVP